MHGNNFRWTYAGIVCVLVIGAGVTTPSVHSPVVNPGISRYIRGGSDPGIKNSYSKYYLSVRTAHDRASILIETRKVDGSATKEVVHKFQECVSRTKRLLSELEREDSSLRLVLKAQQHLYQAIASTLVSDAQSTSSTDGAFDVNGIACRLRVPRDSIQQHAKSYLNTKTLTILQQLDVFFNATLSKYGPTECTDAQLQMPASNLQESRGDRNLWMNRLEADLHMVTLSLQSQLDSLKRATGRLRVSGSDKTPSPDNAIDMDIARPTPPQTDPSWSRPPPLIEGGPAFGPAGTKSGLPQGPFPAAQPGVPSGSGERLLSAPPAPAPDRFAHGNAAPAPAGDADAGPAVEAARASLQPAEASGLLRSEPVADAEGVEQKDAVGAVASDGRRPAGPDAHSQVAAAAETAATAAAAAVATTMAAAAAAAAAAAGVSAGGRVTCFLDLDFCSIFGQVPACAHALARALAHMRARANTRTASGTALFSRRH
jgi:hypothetical protein